MNTQLIRTIMVTYPIISPVLRTRILQGKFNLTLLELFMPSLYELGEYRIGDIEHRHLDDGSMPDEK